MYSTSCTLTKPAPQMIVMSSQNLRPPSCNRFPGTLRRKYFFPSAMAAYALTIETDEQISRNVFRPVSGTLSTAPGCAHCDAMPKRDRKSTRLNSSHSQISYAVFCLKKKKTTKMKTHCSIEQHS